MKADLLGGWKVGRSVVGLVLFAVLILSGCEPEDSDGRRVSGQDAEINSRIESRRDAQIAAREDFIKALTRTINQTQEELRSLRRREGIVLQQLVSLDTESPEAESEAEALEREVAAIGNHIRRQRGAIDNLERTLDNPLAAGQRTEYGRLIASMREDIEARDKMIEELRTKLREMREEIEELRTVYYVAGSPRGLREKGITCRSTFLSRTRLCEVKREHMAEGRNTDQEIDLGSNVRSYRIFTQQGNHGRLHRLEQRGNRGYLVIADPARFWDISKDLVIEVKRR